MTLKEFAHEAQSTLEAHAGHGIPHSHVYELLAAAFGYQSWAAFGAESLLTDSELGQLPASASAQIAGRAIHLQYAQSAEKIAIALVQLLADRQVTAVRWTDLASLVFPAASKSRAMDWEDEDEDYEEEADDLPEQVLDKERLLRSTLLLQGMEQGSRKSPSRLHVLAALHRCERPNSYLYDESLKGRVLNAAERAWVDEYLRQVPQYAKYESQLKAAAMGGCRQAALEYAEAFKNSEFFALAERLSGEIDAERMALLAPTHDGRSAWLRKAAEKGSADALSQLAQEGDEWAEDQLIHAGHTGRLRQALHRAMERGDNLRAWTWQYLAKKLRIDITKSTLAAYHDGGDQDGEFYDSDFGGPLYVAGEEAIELPELSIPAHREAKQRAEEIFRNMPSTRNGRYRRH